MAPNYKGQAFTSDTNYAYDQERGLFFEIVEEGIPSAIDGRMNGWKNQGFDIEVTQKGPYSLGRAYAHRFAVGDFAYEIGRASCRERV